MPDDVNVLKEATCPSLSAASSITYQLGKDNQGNVHVRLTGNSGSGIFNGYWVSMPSILSLLNDQEGPFIWEALCPLYERKSVNSACFLMAALKSEGLVRQSKEQPRRYERGDPKAFMAKVQASMSPKPKPKKGGTKKPPMEIGPPAEPVSDPPADFQEPTEETN